MSLLENIRSPEDLKKLNSDQLPELCAEIREFLVREISVTGGHLSSNLGTVELTVALHRVFSVPTDCIVFDVGHQCYTHKILTGRADAFDGMRQAGGLSGFPCPEESPCDPMVEGHGNVALSQAIGLARAKKLRGEAGTVIAVIGDGAFTGGMVYEGINNIAGLDNLIVILNDNKMSISKNVGAISRYFTRLRTAEGYNRLKSGVQAFLRWIPLLGGPVEKLLLDIKSLVRRIIYRSTWFEDMGFIYHGPIDGHDLQALCNAFANLKGAEKPRFYHIVTVKGKGYAPAEENPGEFHGISAKTAEQKPKSESKTAVPDSFSEVFGRTLCDLAKEDEHICAVTAAMKYGTGLHYMHKELPQRMFDVGMAEQHAVAFAAGLAVGGMKPVVAVYSTFLQRAYDQVIHDIELNHADVLLAVDRAGLVPGDGVTHQGIYDVSFLSQLEDVRIVSPANYEELRYWLRELLRGSGLRVLRYPRGKPEDTLSALGCSGRDYDVLQVGQSGTALVTYGALTGEALEAVQKKDVTLVKLNVLHPIPAGLTELLCPCRQIVFAEESVRTGSVGQQVLEKLQASGFVGTFRHCTVSNFIDHASVAQLRAQQRLDAASLRRYL